MDYNAWCGLSNEELATRDIAEVSAFAVDLPGSDTLDIPACLNRLDEWTAVVNRGIGNALRNRARFPEYDELSEPEYRILTMFSVLYRHLGMSVDLDCLDPTKPLRW